MCFATLLPLGIMQLYESVSQGYFEARQLDFITGDSASLIEWLRLPGDVLFIVFGAIPTLYITFLGVKYAIKRREQDGQGDDTESMGELFTVVSGPSLDDDSPDEPGDGGGRAAPTAGT